MEIAQSVLEKLPPGFIAQFAVPIISVLVLVLGGAATVLWFLIEHWVHKRSKFEEEANERIEADRKRTDDLMNKIFEVSQKIHADSGATALARIEIEKEIEKVRAAGEAFLRHSKKDSYAISEANEKLGKALAELRALRSSDGVYSNAIRGTLGAMKALHKRQDKHETVMKTILKKVGADTTVVGEEQVPKKKSD